MSRLCVMICRVEEADKGQLMTEVMSIEGPEVELAGLSPASDLDDLETQVMEIGWQRSCAGCWSNNGA